MNRLTKALTALSMLACASAVWAEDTPVGAGTQLPSGSKITTSVNSAFAVEDQDDYVIDGYPGQKVTVTVSATKKSALIPTVEVFRPDGTPVSAQDGAKVLPRPGTVPGKKAGVTYKLNQTGVHTIRVRGGYSARLFKGDNPRTPEVQERSYIKYYAFKDPVTGQLVLDPTEAQKPSLIDARTEGEYTITIKYGAPPALVSRTVTANDYGEYRYVVPAVGGAILTSTLTFTGGTPIFTSLTAPNGSNIPVTSVTTVPHKSVALKNVAIPANAPLGGYLLVFQADPALPSAKVALRSTVKLTKPPKAMKAKFSLLEPTITLQSVIPSRGGPQVNVFVTVLNWADEGNDGTARVFLDRLEMDPAYITKTVNVNKSALIRFRTPDSTMLPLGSYDLKVTSSSGQAAVLRNGFTVVPPPEAYTLDPVVGSAAGGFDVTIDGSNFNPTALKMAVRFRNVGDNTLTTPPVTFKTQTENRLVFELPKNLLIDGRYGVQVVDVDTQRSDELPMLLELSKTAAINRVTPGLVPILGGDTMFISGSNFLPTDKVWLETEEGSGTYEQMTVTSSSPSLHQFVAPVRSKGVYRVYVEDENTYTTPTRSFAYYQFADLDLGIAAGTDKYDAWTTALCDFDKDGDLDLFLSRRGGATTLAATSETRILRNSGLGKFTDVTAATMPLVDTLGKDDWRADRIQVVDVTMDGYPDIVIVTNSDKFPPKDAKSHIRILISEGKSLQNQAERVFRDRTNDLMAPIRTMSGFGYGGGNGVNESDDWRALDMFVGDIDISNLGPPEIVITGDKVFENYYVSCTPYCASPFSGGYLYNFYWGGTRAFKWDPSARSGLGRFKYDKDYFPRNGGVTVAVYNSPIPIPTCKSGTCRGRFTPFTGQRLAVGPIDEDGKPDFAILNNQVVKKQGSTISSLQVALNVVGSDGANGNFNITDVTHRLTLLAESDNFQADALAIGQPGFEDGNAYGFIAIAKSNAPASSSAIRILRYGPPALPKDLANFTLVGHLMLPASDPNDRFQSSRLQFLDVDEDGDQDLLALAPSPPGGNGQALRIFRNEVVASQSGIYTKRIFGLTSDIITGSEHYEGDVLAIGDVDGDKAFDFIVTRATPSGVGTQTRAFRTDK